MKNQFKITIILILSLVLTTSLRAQKTIELDEDFNKIIVSPHIEVVFVKGDKSSIELKDITVSEEKFKYELLNNTLQVYLEGAKTYTKSKKIKHNNYEKKVPLYKNRVAQVVITYTDVAIFSIRGEENVVFESPLTQKKCALRFYGDAKVIVKDIKVDDLAVDIYGSSFLTLEKGTVNRQKIRAYGASTVMASNVVAKQTKMTAYGDGSYQLNSSERIKITSYGEAKILYKGNAELKKGIVIGESTIRRMD